MLDYEHTKAVDIYDFNDQRSVFWEYDIVAPCFANVDSRWVRLYFKVDPPSGIEYIHNDIFRMELMENIRHYASRITPLRLANFNVRVAPESTDRIEVEVEIRDRHPDENFKGPSLNDALENLEAAASAGNITVHIVSLIIISSSSLQ